MSKYNDDLKKRQERAFLSHQDSLTTTRKDGLKCRASGMNMSKDALIKSTVYSMVQGDDQIDETYSKFTILRARITTARKAQALPRDHRGRKKKKKQASTTNRTVCEPKKEIQEVLAVIYCALGPATVHLAFTFYNTSSYDNTVLGLTVDRVRTALMG
ncbi:hypothetical protein E2P81_ATG03012 [Venturia nashicola]|uniref:Uncharacterized protein n=1 Tax=Venturia nashicola TaxID=86259 RepID=A0A4Z1PJ78_9PEZI|nr:hypothetical protein E6O75_ATG03076 [Venturia nashicola]TLD36123.1 hypothetical protein E2P81_ATG03012 [Venturia nashicola]